MVAQEEIVALLLPVQHLVELYMVQKVAQVEPPVVQAVPEVLVALVL
jgi:hypothetical protein